MSLEEDVTEDIRSLVEHFEPIQQQGGLWFSNLDPMQKDELLLLSLTGLANAVTRVARAVDALGK
jgi:hypothetical protein